MGNCELRFADLQVAKEQNVEIQRARPIGNARRPVAAKLMLDGQQPIEQLARGERGFQRYCRVDKARLRGKTLRCGRVERRAADHVPQRFEAQSRRRQSSLRRAGPNSSGFRPFRWLPSASVKTSAIRRAIERGVIQANYDLMNQVRRLARETYTKAASIGDVRSSMADSSDLRYGKLD